MNDTRDARRRDGPSGANTGSDSTVPTKLAGPAFAGGGAAARMILGFMAFPRLLWRWVDPSADSPQITSPVLRGRPGGGRPQARHPQVSDHLILCISRV